MQKNNNNNNNNAIRRHKKEYNSGISFSKSQPPKELELEIAKKERQKYRKKKNKNSKNTKSMKRKEYSRGIPMSKSRKPTKLQSKPAPKSPVVSSDISYQTVVSIEDILKKDVNALNNLKQCLRARGWCKVTYPQRTTAVINSAMSKIQKWLESTDPNEKSKYSRKLTDGSNKANPQSEYSYNRIDGFKEGLRILTGDIYKIHYKNDKYPDDVKDDIMKINKEFDDLCVEIMQSVYDLVYGLADYKQFGTAYDISILNQDKPKYSMLDFVNYYNDKDYIANIRNDGDEEEDNVEEVKEADGDLKPNVLKSEFNVFEHSDPGLFALSFASTNEGLEMYDNLSQKWIKIGLNEGIWWNGKTSNIIDNSMKSGQHRIKIDNVKWKPRFTGWYEVSCNKQLKDEIMNEAINMDKKQKKAKKAKKAKAYRREYDSGIMRSKFPEQLYDSSIEDEDDESVSTEESDSVPLAIPPPAKDNNNNNNNVEYNFGISNSKSGF